MGPLALLVARQIDLRQLQISRTGFFSFLHLYCSDQRHDLLSLHTGPLAVLRGQHLRVGPVRLAHREGDLPTNSIPFAAHCIGYPVVTLGFGFKSYVGYRIKQRRQKEIQKENETYYSLLREALPPGPAREEAFNPSPKPGLEERISAPLPTAGGAITCLNQENNLGGEKSSRSPDKQLPRPDSSPDLARDHRANGNHGNPPSKPPNSSSSLSNGDIEYLMERRAPPPPVNDIQG